MRPFLRFVLPILILLVGAFWAALFAASHLPSTPAIVDRYDKLVHAMSYAALALGLASVLIAWRGYQPRFLVWVGVLVIAYGALDEYSQSLVPDRNPDLIDFAFDTAGAVLSLFLMYLAVRVTRWVRAAASKIHEALAEPEAAAP